MLNTLFKTENIKYVISVDDCFAMPEEDQLREELFVDSMVSFSSLVPFFVKYGKEEQVQDIQDMLGLASETEIAPLKQSLIDSLQTSQVIECLNSLHPDKNNLSLYPYEPYGIPNLIFSTNLLLFLLSLNTISIFIYKSL